jgi:hypothetical protein
VTTHAFVLNVLGVIYMWSSGLLLLLMPRFLLLITFPLLSLVGFFPVYLCEMLYIFFFFFIKLHVNISILFFLKRFLLSFPWGF